MSNLRGTWRSTSSWSTGERNCMPRPLPAKGAPACTAVWIYAPFAAAHSVTATASHEASIMKRSMNQGSSSAGVVNNINNHGVFSNILY